MRLVLLQAEKELAAANAQLQQTGEQLRQARLTPLAAPSRWFVCCSHAFRSQEGSLFPLPTFLLPHPLSSFSSPLLNVELRRGAKEALSTQALRG